jgi:hypothetical protein
MMLRRGSSAASSVPGKKVTTQQGEGQRGLCVRVVRQDRQCPDVAMCPREVKA